MIDGTNVLAVQAYHFHVLLNVKTFEHVAPPVMANGKTLSGGKRFLLIPFDQGLPPNPPQLTAEIVCNCENQSIRTLSIFV
jgi:hypothetical protein